MPEEANPTLREAIEKASDDQGKEEIQDKAALAEEEKKDADKAGEKKDEVIASDSEVEEALNFYNALKDPKQQAEIIFELAKRAGFIKPEQTELTKKEEKKYGDLIQEVLGEEYPDLKDKLDQVFKAFEREQQAKLDNLVQELAKDKAERMVTEFESEFSAFIKNNNVSEETAAKMNREIVELPPSVGKNGKRISLTEYLTKIHKIVTSDQKRVVSEEKRVEKIETNLRERSKNLSSDVGDERLKTGSKLPSIRESIQAAARGVRFDDD